MLPKSRLPLVRYELAFDGDLSVPWEVLCVSISEAINEPYEATIEAATFVEVDVDALLGADVSLSIVRGDSEPQLLFGIVEQLDDLGYADHRQCLRFVVVPALALLRQRVASRIWQDSCVLEIVDQVLREGLGEYARSHTHGAVRRGRRPRDYCVQYRESDLDCICRLLEEEGISFAFVHDADAGHEILCLFDDNGQYEAISTIEGDDELPIIFNNPEEAEVESIQTITWTRALTPTGVLRRDFDWREPEQLLSAELMGTDARGRTRRLYAHTQRRFFTNDLAERASDLHKSAALRGAVCRGHSNATVLRPGARFRLRGHDRSDLERAFIVTAVRHHGNVRDSQYSNEFECVPDDAEIRPTANTPRLCIHGPQPAIVTGDEEIHTDAHGRVQVQFCWEEHPSYGVGSSCWIRCAQSWSGPGWGAQFIPRVGMEVIVEFIEGNPDRPLITGCVYDGTRDYPFPLPQDKTQSGWRTRSSPNSEGFNELRFDDAAGREQIYIHGQRDWVIEIEHDEARTVGNDERVTIKHSSTCFVGNSQSTTVGAAQSVSVGAAQSVSVGGGRSVSVGGSESVSVGGGRNVSVGGSESVSVGGGREVNVGGDLSLSSANLSANAGTGTISMTEELRLECGAASISLTKDGDVIINGVTMHSATTGETTIIGSMIKLNPGAGGKRPSRLAARVTKSSAGGGRGSSV